MKQKEMIVYQPEIIVSDSIHRADFTKYGSFWESEEDALKELKEIVEQWNVGYEYGFVKSENVFPKIIHLKLE